MISPERLDELRATLEQVYATMNHGHIPWRLPLCKEWSKKARPIVAEFLGSRAVRHIACNPFTTDFRKFGVPLAYHEYLLETSNPDDPMVIDGTWQQFDVPSVAQAPRVLIATASQTADIFHAHSTRPQFDYIWQPDTAKLGGIFYEIDT